MNPEPWIAEEFEEVVNVLESLRATIVETPSSQSGRCALKKSTKRNSILHSMPVLGIA
jgi:hypothetical protein